MAAREVFELIINADGSAAQSSFSNLAGNVKKEFGDLETKSGGFINNLVSKSPTASAALDKIGVSGGQAGSLIQAAIPAAAVAGAAAIGAFAAKSVGEFQSLAQEVLHFQQVAGGTADEASRWVQTADDFGVSTESLSGAMGKFEKSIGTSPEKLEALGVSIAHTKDGGVDLQGTFYNVIDAFNATEDPTKRATLASQAFGKQWQGLVKLLDAGSASVREDFESISKAQRLTQDDLKNSEKFRLAIDDLNDKLQGLEVTIGRAIVPELITLADTFSLVADAAAKVGGSGGLGTFTTAFLDAANPIHRVQTAVDDVIAETTRIQTVVPHIVSFKDATSEVAISAADTAEYVKAMDKTFKDIDKSAADATKQFSEHEQALAAVATQYGTFGAAAISNSTLSTDALNNMAKEAGGFRDSMFSAFHGATGPMDEFANKSTVTASQLIKSLQDQEQAARNWAANLQTAADAGINEGFLEKLATAGPKAQPILAALLDAVKKGNTDKINQLLQDTDNALTQGANAVLNHKPEWSAAGTGVGAATKDGAKSELDKLGATVGPALGGAASAAKNDALPDWIRAGDALGAALIHAAQVSVNNYHPATTPNQGGGKDPRATATGGHRSAGELLLVGEKGPELMIPDVASRFIPNNVLRSGMGGAQIDARIIVQGNVNGVEDLNAWADERDRRLTQRMKAGAR